MSRSHVGPEGRVIRLKDGRSLGFATFGDATGQPVVNAHGGLAGRLDVMAAAPFAKQAGIRLISPDRPGVGLSDPMPGRTLRDWVDDIEELVDQLELDSIAAMGWSMGGQYAAALAYWLPERVSRVAIIAGALPLTEPGVFQQLPTMDRVFTRLSQRAPLAARASFRMLGTLATHFPEFFVQFSARSLGPADAGVITREPVDNFALMTSEALRTAQGMVEEYRAWMRPWGFAPEDIVVPVDIWWGESDELVPREWPLELARRVPQSTLHVCGGGHFVAHLHYAEILSALMT